MSIVSVPNFKFNTRAEKNEVYVDEMEPMRVFVDAINDMSEKQLEDSKEMLEQSWEKMYKFLPLILGNYPLHVLNMRDESLRGFFETFVMFTEPDSLSGKSEYYGNLQDNAIDSIKSVLGIYVRVFGGKSSIVTDESLFYVMRPMRLFEESLNSIKVDYIEIHNHLEMVSNARNNIT